MGLGVADRKSENFVKSVSHHLFMAIQIWMCTLFFLKVPWILDMKKPRKLTPKDVNWSESFLGVIKTFSSILLTGFCLLPIIEAMYCNCNTLLYCTVLYFTALFLLALI